jgi:hypothetical protein
MNVDWHAVVSFIIFLSLMMLLGVQPPQGI